MRRCTAETTLGPGPPSTGSQPQPGRRNIEQLRSAPDPIHLLGLPLRQRLGVENAIQRHRASTAIPDAWEDQIHQIGEGQGERGDEFVEFDRQVVSSIFSSVPRGAVPIARDTAEIPHLLPCGEGWTHYESPRDDKVLRIVSRLKLETEEDLDGVATHG